MKKFLVIGGVLLLAGCSAAPVAGGSILGALATTLNIVGSAVQTGQEVCAVGQTLVALTDATNGDAPVLVTGKPASDVAKACALINGIVVSPPAAGVNVPSVSIVPPVVTVSAAGVTTSGGTKVTITPADPAAVSK